MLYNTNARLVRLEGTVHSWLMRFSITALRVSMGVIFLGFGALKFVPGLSPAQDLVETTISVMSFGLVPGAVGLIVAGVIECLIGVSLIAGRGLRLTVYLLAAELLGILSPLVLLPAGCSADPAMRPPWRASTSSRTSSWSRPRWSSPPSSVVPASPHLTTGIWALTPRRSRTTLPMRSATHSVSVSR